MLIAKQPESPCWYGFALDRTLARYDHWVSPEHIGEPLAPMLEKLKQYLAEGKRCKIFTARVWFDRVLSDVARNRATHRPEVQAARDRRAEAHRARRAIEDWCVKHVGQKLDVTCQKDPWCLEIWDDIAQPVIANVGPVPPFVVEREFSDEEIRNALELFKKQPLTLQQRIAQNYPLIPMEAILCDKHIAEIIRDGNST
jgi:hypothetical protein